MTETPRYSSIFGVLVTTIPHCYIVMTPRALINQRNFQMAALSSYEQTTSESTNIKSSTDVSAAMEGCCRQGIGRYSTSFLHFDGNIHNDVCVPMHTAGNYWYCCQWFVLHLDIR